MDEFTKHHYDKLIDELGSKKDLTDYQREVLKNALLWEKLIGDARTEEYTDEIQD